MFAGSSFWSSLFPVKDLDLSPCEENHSIAFCFAVSGDIDSAFSVTGRKSRMIIKLQTFILQKHISYKSNDFCTFAIGNIA